METLKIKMNKGKDVISVGLQVQQSGSLHIPVAIRDVMGIQGGDMLDLTVDLNTNRMTLIPIAGKCVLTGETTDLIEVNGKYISLQAISEIDKFIMDGKLINKIQNNVLTTADKEIINENNKTVIAELIEKYPENLDGSIKDHEERLGLFGRLKTKLQGISERVKLEKEIIKMEEKIAIDELKSKGFIEDNTILKQLESVETKGNIRTTTSELTRVYVKEENMVEVRKAEDKTKADKLAQMKKEKLAKEEIETKTKTKETKAKPIKEVKETKVKETKETEVKETKAKPIEEVKETKAKPTEIEVEEKSIPLKVTGKICLTEIDGTKISAHLADLVFSKKDGTIVIPAGYYNIDGQKVGTTKIIIKSDKTRLQFKKAYSI